MQTQTRSSAGVRWTLAATSLKKGKLVCGLYNAEVYLQNMIAALQRYFGKRLLYVGLQGSYLRDEATENSDIDVVVILDMLTSQDLGIYKQVISELEHPEKSCGFICGREEIQNWNSLEICNFLYGTKDYYGRIVDFLPPFTRDDVIRFVKLSVGNLYHEICHRYIHADTLQNRTKLPYTYKNVFFILQSVYYLRTGIFYPNKQELMAVLSQTDLDALKRANRLVNCSDYDFEAEFDFLLTWCQELLRSDCAK